MNIIDLFAIDFHFVSGKKKLKNILICSSLNVYVLFIYIVIIIRIIEKMILPTEIICQNKYELTAMYVRALRNGKY